MTAQDFFSMTDYRNAKVQLDRREEFLLEGKVGKQKISFHGKYVEKGLATSIWNGVDYLLSIQEDHADGGHGYATTDYSSFNTWESFLQKVDETLECRPGYEKQEHTNIQLSLF